MYIFLNPRNCPSASIKNNIPSSSCMRKNTFDTEEHQATQHQSLIKVSGKFFQGPEEERKVSSLFLLITALTSEYYITKWMMQVRNAWETSDHSSGRSKQLDFLHYNSFIIIHLFPVHIQVTTFYTEKAIYAFTSTCQQRET